MRSPVLNEYTGVITWGGVRLCVCVFGGGAMVIARVRIGHSCLFAGDEGGEVRLHKLDVHGANGVVVDL